MNRVRHNLHLAILVFVVALACAGEYLMAGSAAAGFFVGVVVAKTRSAAP